MRRLTAAVSATLLAGTLAACGPTETEVTAGPSPAPSPSTPAAEIRVVEEDEADLQLWVSNQSFEDDPVEVTIAIDGVEVVSEPFEVEGQHSWILFPVMAPPGEHVLTATSDTGATLEQRFTLPEQGLRYAVVDYWFYPNEKAGRHFSWLIQKRPVGFA